MKFTAEQIANIVNGTVEGDPSVEVSQLAKIEEGAMGSITFLANLKYAPYIYDTRASVVIVNNDLKLEKEVHPTLIRVNDAYLAFSQLLSFYNEQIAISTICLTTSEPNFEGKESSRRTTNDVKIVILPFSMSMIEAKQKTKIFELPTTISQK